MRKKYLQVGKGEASGLESKAWSAVNNWRTWYVGPFCSLRTNYNMYPVHSLPQEYIKVQFFARLPLFIILLYVELASCTHILVHCENWSVYVWQRNGMLRPGSQFLASLKGIFWYRYLALICTLEALVKNSIIYWCPLIIASLVGHEHAGQNQGSSLDSFWDSLVQKLIWWWQRWKSCEILNCFVQIWTLVSWSVRSLCQRLHSRNVWGMINTVNWSFWNLFHACIAFTQKSFFYEEGI